MAFPGFDKAEEDILWTEDVKVFWKDVLCQWSGIFAMVCGGAWIILYYGAGYVIPSDVFLLGALGCFIIACFRAYRDAQRAKVKIEKEIKRHRDECEEIWKPKIHVTETSWILTPNEHDFDVVYRATIVSMGFNPIGSCVARLESITKQGVEIFAHVETKLTFVDSGEHYVCEKRLDYSIPAYLQIVGDKAGRIRIASNNHGRTLNSYADEKIQEAGEYNIRITLSAHGSVSVGASFLFTWTGDSNTSSLRLSGQWAIAPTPPSLVPDKSSSPP